MTANAFTILDLGLVYFYSNFVFCSILFNFYFFIIFYC